MKKTIIVMATVVIEGDDVDRGLIGNVLDKLRHWYRWKHKMEGDDYAVVRVELSQDYAELPN